MNNILKLFNFIKGDNLYIQVNYTLHKIETPIYLHLLTFGSLQPLIT